MPYIFRVLLASLLIAGLGLSACGRKGPLERPPAAALAPAASPEAAPQEKPSRPFLLDRLIR